MDALFCQGFQAHHLLADVGECTILPGHLKIAARRAHRLRCQAGVGDADEHITQRAPDILLDSAMAISEAERIHPVEDETGPSIPEVVEVEDRVDHGWR